MLKKYGIGLLALVIAVGAVAFTKPKKVVDMYVFEFKSTQPYTLANVQNTSNTYWEYKGINQALCSNDDIKACRVSVTSAYVNNPTTPTSLSGVTITATESSPGVAYVSGLTNSPTNVYSNKQ